MQINPIRLLRRFPHFGFSLVELVIGILLLAMGITSLFKLFFGTGFQYVVKARDYAIAENLCERFLNIAKAEIIFSTLPPIGDIDLVPEIEKSETLQKSMSCSGNMYDLKARRIVSPCSPSNNLFRATVILSWISKPNDRTREAISLSTMVLVRERK